MRAFAIRLLLVAIMAVAGACAQAEDPAPGPAVELPDPLRWAEVDGAVEYRVQAWSELRLLFEEVRTDPMLALTPSMVRSLRGSSQVRIEVRALGPDGEQVGEVQRQQYGAPGN